MAAKKLKKKKFIILLAVAIVLGACIKSVFFEGKFLYAGTVEATKVDLSSQLASSIATVNVREGDHVTLNQELISLACEDYKADADLAQRNYERNKHLFTKGVVTQGTLDQIVNDKNEADIHVQWCNIRSPINGTVLTRYHEPGEYANPGMKLLTLANIRDSWAYIYVPQTEVAKLKVGMKLIGVLPEMNDRKFEGHIIKINSEAEFTPKNVQTRSERTRLVFGVKVSFLGSNEDEILKPGMTIEIRLQND